MSFRDSSTPYWQRPRWWLTLYLAWMILLPRCAAAWDGVTMLKRPFDMFDNGTKIGCSDQIPCEKIHMEHWDRGTCRAGIATLQEVEKNFWELYNNSDYFQTLPDGSLATDPEEMSLTLFGCEQFCGGWTWYWDAIPRLTTWVIPVLLLLSNIDLSPIDKRRFMTVFHAVGDPIDSFWSLLHKIYIWRRLYAIGLSKYDPDSTWRKSLQSRSPRVRRWWRHKTSRTAKAWTRLATQIPESAGDAAEYTETGEGGGGSGRNGDDDDDNGDYNQPHDRARIVATVLAGFEEIGGAETDSELHYYMLLRCLGNIGDSNESEGAWKEWRRCARELAEARTNEFPRTLLAIFIYVFGVASALYDDIGGGNTSKPGGRIGSAVFLMWLVPMSLLSNTVGNFTSRRTCISIMRVFLERAKRAIKEENERRRQHLEVSPSRAPQSTESVPGRSNGNAAAVSIGSPAMSPHLSPHLSPNLSPEASPSDTLLRQSARPAPPPPAIRQDGRQRRATQAAPATPMSLLQMQPERQHTRARSVGFRVPATPKISVTEAQEQDLGDSSHGDLQSETFRSSRRGSVSPRRGSVSPRRGSSASPGRSSARTETLEMHSSPTHRRASSHGRRSLGEVDPLSDDPSGIRRSSSIDIDPGAVHHRSDSSEALLGFSDVNFQTPRWWTLNRGPTGEELSSTPTTMPRVDENVPEEERSPEAALLSDADDQAHILPAGTWDTYFSWLQPLGAIYTYRPWKLNYRSVSIKSHIYYPSNWYLFFMSLFPIAVSVAGAFIIMWYAVPIGFSCRHIWVVGVFVAWLASTAMTVGLHKYHPFGASDRAIWVWVIVKDCLFGIAGVACVILSTIGLFNRCICWTAYMWHRFLWGDWGKKAYVPLNTDDKYDENATHVYTGVVFGCLALQLLFFFGIVIFWWDGLYVVRWSEDRCRREWQHERTDGGGQIVYTEDNKLLFWYSKMDLEREKSALRERRNTYTAEENQRRGSRASLSFRRRID